MISRVGRLDWLRCSIDKFALAEVVVWLISGNILKWMENDNEDQRVVMI